MILTKEDYAAIIDRHHAAEKRRLLARFDAGAKKYGVLDLDSKNWVREAREESDDRLAYLLFEAARRNLL